MLETLRNAGQQWLFVVKSAISLLLAGWLAMRLELDQPYTAMITVALVIHPHSGMVVAKSFYRALGTIAGSLVGLLLVAVFPQQHELFLGALAGWIALCAGGAALYRNFQSYGFVLAGYTAALVVLPFVTQGRDVFHSAVTRVSEVMLALLVAGVVSDVLFPQRLIVVLRAGIRSLFAGFIAFVRSSLRGEIDRGMLRAAYLRYVRETVQIENQRSSAVFEDAGLRMRSPRLLRFNQRFMASSTTFQSLHHLMDRLQGDEHIVARQALTGLFAEVTVALGEKGSEPCRAAQAGDLERALAVARERLPLRSREVRSGLAGRDIVLDFDTGVELLQRFVGELHDYTRAYVALANPAPVSVDDSRETAFVRGNDWSGAVLTAARTFALMSSLATFWVLSSWPHGVITMLLGTVFCGLLASAPDPLKAVQGVLVGFALGITASFFCTLVVLPRMDGFTLLAAGMLPFLLPGLYLYTQPTLMGTGYLVSFLFTMSPQNAMTYDAAGFINSAVAAVLGIAGTWLSFQLLASASGNRWLRERLERKLRLQVARACHEPLPGLRQRFESASRDLLTQVVSQTSAGTDASRDLLEWGLSVQETGRAVIELRRDATETETASHTLIVRVIATLTTLYDRPGPDAYAAARSAVAAAIDAGTLPQQVLSHLHLIRLALLDPCSVLARFKAPLPAPAAEEERPHAG